MPLVGGEYVWAKGKRITVADSTVVRIDAGGGISGWSEPCPLGANYLPSYRESQAQRSATRNGYFRLAAN